MDGWMDGWMESQLGDDENGRGLSVGMCGLFGEDCCSDRWNESRL
jgi:hypothetical protein